MVQFRASACRRTHCLAAAHFIPCVRVCFFALVVGCSDDPSAPPPPPPPPPVVGTLRVTVSTSGADVDTDGYEVSIDQSGTVLQLGPNGTVTFSGVKAGTYHVALSGVAPNCVLDGGPANVAVLSSGIATEVSLHVTCSAFGTLRVSVATTGDDRDRNGYAVDVSSSAISYFARADISTSNSTAVVRVPAGHYTIQLHGLAANCDGADLGPRERDVVSNATDTLNFAIACEAARRVAFVTNVSASNAEIYTVRSDGAGMLRLTSNDAEDTDPAWSPDGTRIAFTSTRDGTHAIYVMNEDGSGVTRLTPLTRDSFRPAWSPDGSRIAFASARDGNTDIYVMKADGAGEQRLTNDTARDTDPAWAPDGTRIAFSSERTGNADIYVMNADGSGVTRLTSNTTVDTHPAWSPDGTRLAFTGSRCADGAPFSDSCSSSVFVAGLTGTPVEVGGGYDPAWSPDGRRIAVTRVVCDYYYYYYDGECSITGLGILVPFTDGTSGFQQAWDPELTLGPHSKPAWRP